MNTIQLEHSEIKNQAHKFPVCVICDDISSAENVGMVFRVSEAMGVEKLYLCGQTVCPPNKKLLRTSRSTEKYISYSYNESATSIIHELKSNGYTVVALEITNKSVELGKADFKKYSRIALVIGNERSGVSEEVLKETDLSVDIKMHGRNSSMNVVNALSIALYEITTQLSS